MSAAADPTICPSCECPDLLVVDEGLMFGRRRRVYECDYCGRTFARTLPRERGNAGTKEGGKAGTARPAPPPERGVYAYEQPPPCKDCGGRMLVDCTRKGFRWIKCGGCGKRDKQAAAVSG